MSNDTKRRVLQRPRSTSDQPTDDTVQSQRPMPIGPQLLDLPEWLSDMLGSLGAPEGQRHALMLLPVNQMGAGVQAVPGGIGGVVQSAALFDLTLFQGAKQLAMIPDPQAQAQHMLSEVLGALPLAFVAVIVDANKVNAERWEAVRGQGPVDRRDDDVSRVDALLDGLELGPGPSVTVNTSPDE